MERFDVIIVGAGHAGAQAAAVLRQAKFTGSIALVGDEPEYPYHRPPLSKEYMAGEKTFDRILLKATQYWTDQNIELLRDTQIVAIDPAQQRVVTARGKDIGYGSLVWAAGGTPRRLSCPGASLGGVTTIRARADIDRIMNRLEHIDNVVVIGGGYIGLEAAAVLRKMGRAVTVVEAQSRVLSRVAGPMIADYMTARHRSAGCDFRLATGVQQLIGEQGQVEAVQLANGEQLPADLVVVGIGIEPNVAPLLAIGAEGGNGVLVDDQCRTTLDNIYAIGDCALHVNRYADNATIRLESVQNANDMAAVAAKTIAGLAAEYNSVPWFWSNQFDIRLQTMGLSSGFDEELVRGDPSTDSFSVFYRRNGRLTACDSVNAPADYVQSKMLIMRGGQVDAAALTDPGVMLKDLA
ncbi:NAD(P)/FAD-dependent oxidoreductase [Parvularcula sp. LCG005]|uniref:NAD(P)/FAD-dependent oxidoreductase n=1 Tax=Parvularcula sp. LCG005 TaxID=3078805 RepID=UPI002942440B|nr:FAD-dependent oxidoreductase [Parvularcula sp. LCG005]WOI52152.1 FAD-dependent oxidoreductase [Parvularcula sp. LCG005]